MFRAPLDVTVPRVTVASLDHRARSRPRGAEVRVRVSGDALVARRWVRGHFATGHSVLRARLEQTHGGLRVQGTVAPSGLDLTLAVVWWLGAIGVVAVGVAAGAGAVTFLAFVPAVFGVWSVAMLPRDVRAGRDVIERTLVAEL